jgi:hypothetical protein
MNQSYHSHPNQNPPSHNQRPYRSNAHTNGSGNGPSGNGNQFRRNDLLRRQHDLADEMDNLTAWEQALCAQFQLLSDMEQRVNGQKGVAALSILLAGRSAFEQQFHYQRARIAQERFHLQQQWTSCQSQKAAVVHKLQRVQFELSLC